MQEEINILHDKLEECKIEVHGKFKKGSGRMDTFETNLNSIEHKLDRVLELHDDFKGFFKVMGFIGKFAVWATKISIFLGAVWLIIRDHIK